jgi:hypothetical protein
MIQIKFVGMSIISYCTKLHLSSSWFASITNSVAQKPEGSSPHSQQPATGPYPEPVESNPHPPSQSP